MSESRVRGPVHVPRGTTREPAVRFRIGELFCGPGGIALGAHDAAGELGGIELSHSWATDYDADTCATYARNVPGASATTVHHMDIKDFAPRVETLEGIDGLSFGFPCNDFSSVGQKLGFKGEFGPLYEYGVDVLRRTQPMWFVAENVGGLRSSDDGVAFKKILRDLESSGYTITPHLYQFEKYGVPQNRHRIMIVGIRNDLDVRFEVPSPAPYAGIDTSSRTAIETPAIPHGAPNHQYSKITQRVADRLGYINPGENAFNATLPKRLRLNVNGATLSQIYRRLDPAKPSYTVTGSGGGGTYVYHWSENRPLTSRERARLQTFPDWFEFEGKLDSVRKQVGMAVPVRGAKVIFKALFQSFLGQEYPSVSSNLLRFMPTSGSEHDATTSAA
jgi:DNA (cytosine-5)-methyltransferase 1